MMASVRYCHECGMHHEQGDALGGPCEGDSAGILGELIGEFGRPRVPVDPPRDPRPPSPPTD